MTADHRRIARHLAASGPTHGDRLAAALGLTEERFWVLINHPWFQLVRGGYDLTEQGRREGLADEE